MATAHDVEKVETEGDFVHVRFQDPDEFESIRTPDWADEPANSVQPGAEVRTGEREDGDDWEIQSVLIPKDVGEEQAREEARKIVEKIES